MNTWYAWLSVLVASLTVRFACLYLIGLLLKLVVPLSWFGGMKLNEAPLSDEEEKSSVTTVLRRSYRQSVRKS
jgi:hypothetical protein